METRNESGLEKPATFNSAHVRKAHVLSEHGNRLIVFYAELNCCYYVTNNLVQDLIMSLSLHKHKNSNFLKVIFL